MTVARASHTATLLAKGQVLVAGGSGGELLDSAELYDPGTGTWAATGSMGTARASYAATALPGGEVLVSGGADQAATSLPRPSCTTPGRARGLPPARRGHLGSCTPRRPFRPVTS
jgi:hypothetical protein